MQFLWLLSGLALGLVLPRVFRFVFQSEPALSSQARKSLAVLRKKIQARRRRLSGKDKAGAFPVEPVLRSALPRLVIPVEPESAKPGLGPAPAAPPIPRPITLLLGILLMLAASLQAWPDPIVFPLVCIIDFAVLTFVAFRYRLPIVHAAALLCLALGYLGLLHQGQPLTFDIFTSATSGVALVGLVLFLEFATELLVRKGFSVHAVSYSLGAGAVALWSMLLVTLPARGIQHPMPAMAVYAIYGVSALVMNVRWRRPLITSVGLALLTGSTLWALRLYIPKLSDAPVWGAVLGLEALVLGFLAATLNWTRPRMAPFKDAYREPLARSGEALSVLAILTALSVGIALRSWALAHVVTSGCLLAGFLIPAVVERRVGMARLAGLMLIGGVVAGTGWAMTMTGELELARQLPAIGFWIAVAGCIMAAVATWAGREGHAKPWYRILFAWREMALVAVALGGVVALAGLPNSNSLLTSYTGLFLAAAAFILVWGYQSAFLTWIGSTFVLCSIGYALVRRYPRAEFLTPCSLALLYHATIALVAGFVLKNRFKASRVLHLFAEPLSRVALVSSFLALPILVFVPAGTMFSSLGLFWLAVVWLVISVEKRWPVLFSACQAVLVMAVLFGTTAWLESQTWFMDYGTSQAARFFDPRSLQAYGISLAAFCFVCMAGRISVQRTRARSASKGLPLLALRAHIIPDSWFAVDRLVLAGLVLGQAALAVFGVLPGVMHELLGSGAAEQAMIWPKEILPFAFGSGAWIMLALIAIVLVAGLWEKHASSSIVGLIIAAATLPVLAAGPHGEQQATASALRLGLAVTFLACSVLVWSRAPWCRQAVKAGCQVKEGTNLPEIVRWLLLVFTATPVLILTGLVSYLGLISGSPPKPGLGSFFDQIGWVANNVLPPALISFVLAGYALRERSPVFALVGGLIAELTIMGGYTLGAVASGGSLELAAWVGALQLGAITAGIWAIGWLLTRFWLPHLSLRHGASAGLGSPPHTLHLGEPAYAGLWASATGDNNPRTPLLHLQVTLPVAGNAVLWAAALALLWLSPENPSLLLPFGETLGWLAWLVAGAGALVYLRRISVSALIHLAAGFGLGLGVLAACWACRWDVSGQWLAYHVLTLAWTLIALLLLLAWRAAETVRRRSGEMTTENLPRRSFSPFLRFPVSLSHGPRYAVVSWLEAFSILVLTLAISGAWSDPQQPYWSAGAALASSAVCGGLALWMRRPLNVYAAGLLMNLAGAMIWIIAVNQPWERLVYISILSLATGCVGWSILDLWLARKKPAVGIRRGWLPVRPRYPPRCG